ncbi:cysteine hydrolase family protein [Halosimplex amylolyticum]|uniref:cysteine hydrolase family protein n=1 Tax=Halosimplex amylolyticum TaxID=3396616 RepID=UPI003F57FF2E
MSEYVRPNPDRAVLLTIDTQNDFTVPGSPAEIDGTADAVPQMQRLVEAFRSADAPIVHVVRLYKADGSNVDRCRRASIESGAEIVRPGTDGAELVEELKPAPDVHLDAARLVRGEFQDIGPREWVMYKPRWGAFYRTDLSEFLDARTIDTVVVCGCNFPNCPRTTVYEASERDYRVVLVPDATSGVYERGLREIEQIGVALKDTTEAVEWVRTAPKTGE